MTRPSLRGAILIITASLLFAGCGTRADDAAIRAGAGGGPATLSPAQLDSLRDSLATSAPGPTATPVRRADMGPLAPVAGTDREPTIAPGATPSGTDSGAAAQSPSCGAATSPLRLGQIGSFSGVSGPITGAARATLAVWAKSVNASGGLACHPVEIYAADDGADPSRAAALVQELASQHKVQALVAVFAPLSMSGLVPAVEKAQIPVIGGDSLAPEWYEHALLFPQGAGLENTIRAGLKRSVGEGKTRLGLLYCVEASVCTDAVKLYPALAKQAGAEVVYSSAVSITQTDFTAQCQNAMKAGVQVLRLAVDGSTIGRVARSCAALGYFPQLATSGLVISAAQSEDPLVRRFTVSTVTGNAPWTQTDAPGQRAYAAALTQYAPGTEPDGVGIATWAAATLLTTALQQIGPSARTEPIMTVQILEGLGRIKRETLGGLAPPITFSPRQKSAPPLSCVYYMLLTPAGWTAPRANEYVCN